VGTEGPKVKRVSLIQSIILKKLWGGSKSREHVVKWGCAI